MFKGLKEGNWLDLRNQEDWNIGEMVRQARLRFFMGSWATFKSFVLVLRIIGRH